MKKILIALIFLLIPLTVSAQSANSVWFTGVPDAKGVIVTPKAGDDILIYARINNTSPDPITYTVSFATVPDPIGTKTATIPGYTEQSLSVASTMPEAAMIATATIDKALDKNKKEIVAMKGTLIGSVALSNSPTLPKFDGVKGFFGKTLAKIEIWRLKQLDRFIALRKESQTVLGTTTLKDISDVFQPEKVGVPGEETSPEQPDRHTMDYLKLMYATMGEYYLAHKTFFYVSLVLVGLFVIRFIFGRFF